MTWMRCRCLIGVSAALIGSVGVALAQPATADLEQRAFRLGVEAATDARANQANAETVVAERYRRALALSTDESVQARLKEAFTRGYQSGLSGAQPATALPPRPYVHPRHRYQFVPPAGWTMNDQVPTSDVQMKSADGNALIEITSGPISERLDPVSYAAGWESKSVGSGQPLVAKRAGRAFNLNGEIAYAGIYTGQGVLVKVVFVGTPGRFFVCTGVFAADDFDRAVPAFDAVVQSLRLPQ